MELKLGLPLLGSLLIVRKRRARKTFSPERMFLEEPKSNFAEAIRTVRTGVVLSGLDNPHKIVAVTSTVPGEGKTTVSMNLSLALGQMERVLLVDADLRKPLVNKYYGLPIGPGLTDYVLGNYHWHEVTNTISDIMLGDFGIDDILKTPGMDTLHIITAGTKPPNPSEILTSHRFREFLKEARNTYDFIFIDAPPVMPVADASDIATLVDGVILVYLIGKIGRGVLRRVKANLENVDARLTGVILNKVKSDAGPDYYQYHSYYYYGNEPEVKKGKKVKKVKKAKRSKKSKHSKPNRKVFSS